MADGFPKLATFYQLLGGNEKNKGTVGLPQHSVDLADVEVGLVFVAVHHNKPFVSYDMLLNILIFPSFSDVINNKIFSKISSKNKKKIIHDMYDLLC